MKLRFDEFMQTALYHPERGYYTSRIKTVGRGGDFATSATLSDSLARAIAHQFQKSGLRNLIEVGPGDGSLAATIRRNLPLFKRLRLQQHLVELSPVLSAQQKKRNPKARHHSSIASALQICQGHAFIYSNELVDAFPVRIFRTSAAAAPEELFLNQQSSTWHESWQPATNLPASTFFSTKLNPHQRFEVHETYHTWFSSWQDHWHTGQILTIDYGGIPSQITHRRPNGTLRAYFQNQLLPPPEAYQNPGFQDLTADVNFEDLQNLAHKNHLKNEFLTSQREFLLPHLRQTSSDQFLSDPQGAGGSFQVLLQSKT